MNYDEKPTRAPTYPEAVIGYRLNAQTDPVMAESIARCKDDIRHALSAAPGMTVLMAVALLSNLADGPADCHHRKMTALCLGVAAEDLDRADVVARSADVH
jgi:hypothetical protein